MFSAPVDPNHKKTQFNILLLGDAGVGKTSLLLRSVDDTYSEQFISNIGADFKTKNISYHGTEIELKIYDRPDAERYPNSGYCKGADAIIIVYDVTDYVSFHNVQKHYQGVRRGASENTLTLLVGNKCDLSNKIQVGYNGAKEIADTLHITLIEASARDNINVESIFQTMVNQLMINRGVISANSTAQIDALKKWKSMRLQESNQGFRWFFEFGTPRFSGSDRITAVDQIISALEKGEVLKDIIQSPDLKKLIGCDRLKSDIDGLLENERATNKPSQR